MFFKFRNNLFQEIPLNYCFLYSQEMENSLETNKAILFLILLTRIF